MGESRGTFQKWKKKMNKKVNTLSSKTSFAVDRSKARKQIGVFEEEIKVLKQEIGEIVNMNRNSLFSVTMVNYQLAQIETKESAIAQLEQEIEELSARSKAAGIKEEVVKDNAGNYIVIDEINTDTPITQTFTCDNCNMHFDEPKKFCEKCGYSMSVSEQELKILLAVATKKRKL